MRSINTIVIAVGGRGRRISSDLKKRKITASKIFLKLNGKPILSYLIDMALDLNFQEIFLLSGYYEKQLHSYLAENYIGNKRIIPIYRGKNGRKGIPRLLYSIKNKLHKPFIYSDGNIVYGQDILRCIQHIEVLKSSLANIVLSAEDLAPTHSRVVLKGGQIQEIYTRLGLLDEKRISYYGGKCYYSLGLMALSPSVFSSIPYFNRRKDLDYVISDIFKTKKTSVLGTVYEGNWFAVHTIQDT